MICLIMQPKTRSRPWKGTLGKDEEDSFSSVITESEGNTDDVYKLDITTKMGKITTVNLKSKRSETGS